jgi:hypothetical protein
MGIPGIINGLIKESTNINSTVVQYIHRGLLLNFRKTKYRRPPRTIGVIVAQTTSLRPIDCKVLFSAGI